MKGFIDFVKTTIIGGLLFLVPPVAADIVRRLPGVLKMLDEVLCSG